MPSQARERSFTPTTICLPKTKMRNPSKSPSASNANSPASPSPNSSDSSVNLKSSIGSTSPLPIRNYSFKSSPIATPFPFHRTGLRNETTCKGSVVSRSLPSNYPVSSSALISRLLLIISRRRFHRRYRYRYPTRRHQGEGGRSIAQIQDEGTGPTENGQDRYRLSEIARCVLQVSNQAQDD